MNPGHCAIRPKLHIFIFVYKNSSLKFLDVKIVSAVVANTAVSTRSERSTQLTTSNSIAIAFEELNDEGTLTTVFRAWNNVSTSLHDQTTHRQSIGEARI